MLEEGGSEVNDVEIAFFTADGAFFGAVVSAHAGDLGLAGFLDLLDDHARAADLALLCHQLHAPFLLQLLNDGLHRLLYVHMLHVFVVGRLLENGGELAPAFRHDIFI